VERLRKLHASFGDAGLPPGVIQMARTQLEVQLRAVFTLMAALQRDA
jgi:hypothetical protein